MEEVASTTASTEDRTPQGAAMVLLRDRAEHPGNDQPNVSAYLRLPPRTLEEACAQANRNDAGRSCARCELADLCRRIQLTSRK